jgi:hypothetical protein
MTNHQANQTQHLLHSLLINDTPVPAPPASPADRHDDHSTEERYTRALQRIQREDELMNHRMNWLLTSQTILLGAYTIQFSQQQATSFTHPIFAIIPAIALLMCCIMHGSIIAAVLAIRFFREPFQHTDIVGVPITHYAGLMTPIVVPIGFVGVWWFIFLTFTQSILLPGIITIVWIGACLWLWRFVWRVPIRH